MCAGAKRVLRSHTDDDDDDEEEEEDEEEAMIMCPCARTKLYRACSAPHPPAGRGLGQVVYRQRVQ